jgi:hypothetical protein
VTWSRGERTFSESPLKASNKAKTSNDFYRDPNLNKQNRKNNVDDWLKVIRV